MTDDFRFADNGTVETWRQRHAGGYHGTYEEILERNRGAYGSWRPPENRLCYFHFDPQGKVVHDIGCGGGWFMLDCLAAGATKVYGLEIDSRILTLAKQSFDELGVPSDRYQLVNVAEDDLWQLPPANIIYCMTVFMHIPLWQTKAYFAWIAEKLLPGGEAHLQFYQVDGRTRLYDGEDDIMTSHLEQLLDAAGLVIRSRRLLEGEGILPVWYLYCVERKQA